MSNLSRVLGPFFFTAMFATISYPLLIRISKKIGFSGFYSMHLSIAPFMALINVFLFSGSKEYFDIKHREHEHRVDEVKENHYDKLKPMVLKRNYQNFSERAIKMS
jgi:hypothetical protein